MAQGDCRHRAMHRVLKTQPVIRVLTNKIVRSRTEHELSCGCLLDKGVFYHKIAALYDGVFVARKGHMGPCPKSGVVN